jgi:O-antigen ligase
MVINISSVTKAKLRIMRRQMALGVSFGLAAALGGLILGFGGAIAGAAVLMALVAAIVILRDIEVGFWSVIGVICLLPFATIPVDIGLTPTLLDIALGATVGIWILRIVSGRFREVASAPITVPLLAFMIVAVFSFVFGLNNGPFTPNLVRHFAELLLSLSFVLVLIDHFATWERVEKAVVVVMVAGAFAAIIAIGLWLIPDLVANDLLNLLQRVGYPGGLVIRYIEDNPELAERAIGTSVDPNALGGLLLMIGALSFPQLVAKRPLLPRWLAYVCTGLIFLALVLTYSRGAMVGLAGGLAFIIIMRYRRLIPYLMLFALIFLLMPFTQGYLARFLEGFQLQDLATQMRIGEYRDAIALMARYPLFGVGFSGSPDIDLYLGVASVYLTIGQQMGVLGLLAFTALITTAFVYGLARRHRFLGNDRLEPVWLGLHAAVVGGLVVGIFDHYLFNIDFHHAVTSFWLFFGLAVASTRIGGTVTSEMPDAPEQSGSVQAQELGRV